MVNVLGVAKGSILEYGETMESDRVLQVKFCNQLQARTWFFIWFVLFQEWISAQQGFPFGQGEGEKWGKFVMIHAALQQLTQNIPISKSSAGNFEELVKIINNSMKTESSSSSWLKRSGQMIEYANLLTIKSYNNFIRSFILL